MSENQHYEYATAAFSSANARASAEFNAEARADAQIQATLAIAYEQRTANLIAAFGHLNIGEDDVTFLGERIDGYELAKQIQERLNLK
jgi:hypothetical protein